MLTRQLARSYTRSWSLCARLGNRWASTDQSILAEKPLEGLQTNSQSRDTRQPVNDTSNKMKIGIWGYKLGNPHSPSSVNYRLPKQPHLHKGKPHKPLTIPLRRKGGRNHTGRVVIRHVGGGHKRRIRLIDFRREKPGLHEVVRIEYDPNRSAHIALLKHLETGEYSYNVAVVDQRAGDVVESFRSGIPEHIESEAMGDPNVISAFVVKRGNCVPLKYIPNGSRICLIGINATDSAKLCRSAGTYGVVVKKESKFAIIQLSSGEIRKLRVEACATIGTISNPEWRQRILGKAGRLRNLGVRPTVNGTSMNACDHNHGGGRGHAKGYKRPVSNTGIPKFKKTRIGNSKQNRLVVQKRPSKRLQGRK